MKIKVTIKLGDIELDAFQLEDGSYASPGLFRLAFTDVYRYEEFWYWLGSEVPSRIENLNCWDLIEGHCLAFEGNRLSYLSMDSVDPEREISYDNVEYFYCPVPNDVVHVIGFCIKGHLASDEDICKLTRMFDGCYSGGVLERAANRAFLLRDTGCSLPKPKVRGIASNSTDVSTTPKKPGSKISKERSGLIYLVKLDAHLKLGFTQNLSERLKAFQTTNVKVDLVKSVKGTLCREKQLHATLGSKVRELYCFEDEQKILKAMDALVRSVGLE
jgi:hypothetical protein